MNETVQKLANKIKPIQIKLEMVLFALLCIGVLLRDTEMGKQLTLISLGTLAILYFIMAFRREDPNNRLLNFINKLTHLSYSIGMLGILFTINHYPNAGEMLIIGLLSIIFGLIGLLIIKFLKKSDPINVDSDMIRALVIASIIAGLLAFGNLSDFGPNHPEKNIEKQELIDQL